MDFEKEFSKIYDEYIDKIFRFIYLKVNSQEIAEDICSETFLRFFKTLKKKQDKIENIQAFLYRIARNLVFDHYREKAKVQFVSTDFVPVIDQNVDLEKKALIDSEIETIKSALFNLKEDYQEVIILYYLNDLPVSDIAETLNKSENSVRVLIHRALNSLKNELEKNNT